MPGNARSGRNPKPLALHVLEGTFRKDRHAVTAAPIIEGAIKKPTLKGEAATLWRKLIEPLIGKGVVTPGDVPAATMLCETWALYRAALKAALADPLSKEARCAVTAYLSGFDRLASRFGLTPADRVRLRLEPPKQPSPVSKRRRNA